MVDKMVKIYWWEKRGIEILNLINDPALNIRQHIIVNNITLDELFWLTILTLSISIRAIIKRIKRTDFIEKWENITKR
jgi:hypothetical protein